MTHRRVYEVVITGRAGSSIAASFAPLMVHSENGETTISGARLDAAMLGGVLRTIERTGLELVAIRSYVVDDA
jgi:hypothetical protein